MGVKKRLEYVNKMRSIRTMEDFFSHKKTREALTLSAARRNPGKVMPCERSPTKARVVGAPCWEISPAGRSCRWQADQGRQGLLVGTGGEGRGDCGWWEIG